MMDTSSAYLQWKYLSDDYHRGPNTDNIHKKRVNYMMIQGALRPEETRAWQAL